MVIVMGLEHHSVQVVAIAKVHRCQPCAGIGLRVSCGLERRQEGQEGQLHSCCGAHRRDEQFTSEIHLDNESRRSCAASVQTLLADIAAVLEFHVIGSCGHCIIVHIQAVSGRSRQSWIGAWKPNPRDKGIALDWEQLHLCMLPMISYMLEGPSCKP